MCPLLRTQTPAGTTSMTAVARYVCVAAPLPLHILIPTDPHTPLPMTPLPPTTDPPYPPTTTGDLGGACVGRVSISSLL